jgi:methyltransferase family protein/phosphopantetheine binding protein
MAEWLDQLAGRILGLHPRNVLEIGVGNGMLFRKLVPFCKSYWATDVSDQAIAKLKSWIAKQDGPASGGVLLAAEALDTAALPESYFDLIILNSVVQYFPSSDYLEQVLQGLLKTAAPGARFFLGDARNLCLAPHFGVETCLRAAGKPLKGATLRRAELQAIANESELLIDPDYFLELSNAIPALTSTEIHLKRGYHENELTRYRYDVILRTDEPGEVNKDHVTLRWGSDVADASDIERYLRIGSAESIQVLHIPDRRLSVVTEIIRQVGLDTSEPRHYSLTDFAPSGVLAEDLYAIGGGNGYEVQTKSSHTAGFIDALYSKPSSRAIHVFDRVQPHNGKSIISNSPFERISNAAFIASLREYARAELPKYMTPAVFVPVTTFPLTPNGKVDRASLPPPAITRALRGSTPSTDTEHALCALITGLLNMDNVWIDDDFFELGGDSIFAALLAMRARSSGFEFSVRDVFEQRTPARLAQLADQHAVTSPDIARAKPDSWGDTRRYQMDRAETAEAERLWQRLQQEEGLG